MEKQYRDISPSHSELTLITQSDAELNLFRRVFCFPASTHRLVVVHEGMNFTFRPEPLPGAEAAIAAATGTVPGAPPPGQQQVTKPLEEMSQKELITYGATIGLTLKSSQSKADMVAAILATKQEPAQQGGAPPAA
jgi:hypothetical protein